LTAASKQAGGVAITLTESAKSPKRMLDLMATMVKNSVCCFKGLKNAVWRSRRRGRGQGTVYEAVFKMNE
jgi:hypothetical protein